MVEVHTSPSHTGRRRTRPCDEKYHVFQYGYFYFTHNLSFPFQIQTGKDRRKVRDSEEKDGGLIMENWSYLVGAYTIAWLGVSLYLFVNAKKQKGIEERLSDIEDLLKDKE
ncbi:MAG TPA: CcmD family protein [Nitrospirae bacterium]|nr:CcmD family protein [Nitrospirota bacterium]HDO67186.1 CcmD family protein [Nitrospirota bacterium]HDZ84341.1 CcmD family protein [Nitrospirota bacterium]HEW81360.1 CcmD family protein [Nitrospirota bacterium]